MLQSNVSFPVIWTLNALRWAAILKHFVPTVTQVRFATLNEGRCSHEHHSAATHGPHFITGAWLVVIGGRHTRGL